MAAATASRVGSSILRAAPRGRLVSAQLAADTTFFMNTLVGIRTSDGFAEPVSSTGSYSLVGVITEDVDTTGETAGAIKSDIRVGILVELVAAGLTQADQGARVHAADDQTVTVESEPVETEAIVAGAAAGNVTVTGIGTNDELISVTHLVGSGTDVTDVDDLTSEFSITAADTINNAGGTDTSGNELRVRWLQDAAEPFVGYIEEVISATSALVFVEGRPQ